MQRKHAIVENGNANSYKMKYCNPVLAERAFFVLKACNNKSESYYQKHFNVNETKCT